MNLHLRKTFEVFSEAFRLYIFKNFEDYLLVAEGKVNY